MLDATKKKLLIKKVEEVEAQVFYSELMMGLYETMRDAEDDEKKKAGIQLKIDQLKEAAGFNQKFLDYVKTL